MRGTKRSTEKHSRKEDSRGHAFLLTSFLENVRFRFSYVPSIYIYLFYFVSFRSVDDSCFVQQALENSGLSVVPPQSDATSRELQNQSSESSAAEVKKVQSPDKPVREKKRSIFKKPIQMPGIRGGVLHIFICQFTFLHCIFKCQFKLKLSLSSTQIEE